MAMSEWIWKQVLRSSPIDPEPGARSGRGSPRRRRARPRAAPDVEAVIDAGRDPALTGEEGVAHAGQGGQQGRGVGLAVRRSWRLHVEGGRRPARRMKAGGLEQRPICAGSVSRSSWAAIGRLRSGAAAARAAARWAIPSGQELALGQQRRGHQRPAATRGGQHGGEVGVDGQVGPPGVSSGSTFSVALQGLQGVAGTGRVAAVVDQQGRAAVGGEARADLGAERLLGGRALEHRWGGRLRRGPCRVSGRGARPKARPPASSRPTTRSAQPFRPHELAGGQAVEHLVGDQDQGRAGGTPSSRRPSSALGSRRPAQGLLARRGGGGSTSHRSAAARKSGRQPWRRAACRPSACRRRGRPRPAGTALGRAQRARLDGPQADQLAEHLADQRGGDEVAGRAQAGPGGVVAVAGRAGSG
jgi:hypothetical protein